MPVARPLRGRIFDVSRSCFDDGPGLRTVVFLKGCALRCPWCHNPEGLEPGPELARDATRCIRCGACREACPRRPSAAAWPRWRDTCRVCGSCAGVCPSGARRLVGREVGVEEVVDAALVDRDFCAATGGGVTLSGGEPLAQPRFLEACAAALEARGVSVALETSGAGAWAALERVLRHLDLVVFDLKHAVPERWRSLGAEWARHAPENLRRLLRRPVPVEVRLTLVPGFNDSDEDLRAIARWLREGPRLPPLRLLGFHRLATAKQDQLGRPYPYARVPPLSEERLAHARALLAAEGLELAE